jgi:hypothetical protein
MTAWEVATSIVCLDPQAKGPGEGASNETPDSRFSTECTRPHRPLDGSRKDDYEQRPASDAREAEVLLRKFEPEGRLDVAV